jgi:hypothetical protein
MPKYLSFSKYHALPKRSGNFTVISIHVQVFHYYMSFYWMVLGHQNK